MIPDGYNTRLRRQFGEILSVDWLPFYNDSGEEIPAYAVMRIDSVDRSNGVPYFKCKKPNDTFYRYYAINSARTCAVGARGRCTLLVPRDVLYDDGATPTINQSWGPKSGSWKLWPNRPGFTIFGSPTSGRVWCRQYEVNLVKGKLAGALAVGGTANISLWFGAGGSEADASITLSTRDWLMTSGADDIASGKKVVAQWDCGTWYITEAECP